MNVIEHITSNPRAATTNSQLLPVYTGYGFLCSIYFTLMTTNPYVSQLIEQTGMTEREAHQSSTPSKRSFPCTIYGRYFACEADYEFELAQFLNGN